MSLASPTSRCCAISRCSVGYALVAGLVGLPLSIYGTFGIEARFGFNKMTWQLWLADMAKGLLLGALLGLPLAALVLWLMQSAGSLWWLYAWLAWSAFQLLMLVLYPTFIAPLFNKFTPLEDGAVKSGSRRCSPVAASSPRGCS